MSAFSSRVVRWYKHHGRHDLPWQTNPTAYRVWVSEIMLQQTQVSTVIGYYKNFMRRFPNLKQLALASQDDVLAHWSGLGYYARARNLHKTAMEIHHNRHGRFPCSVDQLERLPGIGRSTAGAIVSFAKDIPAVILDGNVKRVIARHQMVAGWPGNKKVHDRLWQIAEQLTPKSHIRAYNQAMMDLGATVCTRSRPLCLKCPVNSDCQAYKKQCQNAFPEKKPKSKSRRQEQVYMLIILRQDQHILLEKRPAQGIWGGLWSFPEATNLDQLQSQWQNKLATPFNRATKLTAFDHRFSHFDLHIQPVMVQARSIRQVNESAGYHWHHVQANVPGGIAAPIKKIFNDLQDNHHVRT